MSQPASLITIVVPVYNRAGIVERTLESIRQQSHRPLSVVLVDNNSTDNTPHVLRKWKSEVEAPDMQVTIADEPVAGAPAARNRGLGLTNTPYVMFFDSDDIMTPTHVQRAVDAITHSPQPDIAGWDIGITTLRNKRIIRPFYATDCIWHCIMHGSMATQRYVVRTSLARQAGAWNNDMHGWNDIEFGIRLLRLRPSLTKSRGPITVEAFHLAQSITGTAFSLHPHKWEAALDEIERHLTATRLRRYVQLRRAILAGDYAREGAKNEATRLLAQVTANEKCPFYRLLYRIAYSYNSHGGKGIARLLRPLF